MSRMSGNTRVAVVRGGPSDEYEISMRTGNTVLNALAERDYTVEDIVISRSGEWLKDGYVRSPQQALAATDVVFIALHGAYGEDGTLQRELERLSIPFTGSRSYPSSVAMNKLLTKELLKRHGIKLAPHFRVTKSERLDVSRAVATITDMFGPEYVIKPIAGGSSIGTHVAASSRELLAAIENAFATHDDVLVEKRIRGKEATCGVIENFRNARMYRLPAIEIVPPESAGFFAAEVKYTGETEEICPGRFRSVEKQELAELAHCVHTALELSQYSRSDFIVAEDGIYFLEVNTLPGLTEQSLVPKSLAAVGCSYGDFITHLLADALDRGRRT